jgi:hypothetical protein
MNSCSTTSSVTVSDPNPDALVDILRKRSCARRRRISPEAGRALEILGHAIEYLGDEFGRTGGSADGQADALNAQMEAVQLLMEINRQIYFQCPEVPSLGTRWRELLHFPSAK